MVNEFRISATSDKFWNQKEFIEFLINNSGSKIKLSMDPEAICLHSLGVYDMLEKFGYRDVSIDTMNPLECHPVYTINLVGHCWLSVAQQIDPGLHSWNGSKIFYALFGRPTAARLAIGSYLHDRHWETSHVHFSAELTPDNLVQFEFDKLLAYDVESIGRAGQMLQKLPLLLSNSNRYTAFNGYDFQDPLTSFYRDIFVDVIVESHVLGNTFFPTEKTARPIWLKKPFVVFASRDFLCYLRQMGFKTFHDFWDEDYDGFETRDRLIRIYKLLDWIASRSRTELQSMYIEMSDILDHNYSLLSEQTFQKKIKKIV